MDLEESRIEKLKRALYSRNEEVIPKEERGTVHSEEYNTPKNWGESPSFDIPTEAMVKKSNSFFNKFLMFSLGFFVLAVGVSAFIFFGGFNMISSSNIDVKIIGSNSASSGEELDLSVDVQNQNRTNLENVVLNVEYPDGVTQVGELKNPSRTKINIGTMTNGQSVESPLKVLFLGEKGAVKTIMFRVEYTVAGSNAVFSKEKTYDVTINSSPIIMEVSYPKEINSGQEVALNIDLTSNSSTPMQNVLVKVEYPYGFTYTDSSIKPLRNNSLWAIGDLKNGDKKSLVVKGTIVGQNMEDRSFRISAGTQSNNPLKDFDTDLAVNQITLGIRKSFFNLSVENLSAGNAGGVSINQSASVKIGWQNTLPDKILNGNIVVKLTGNVFDKSGVTVDSGGFYRSLDSSISWDKNTTPDLKEISPGKTGTVGFSLRPISGNTFLRSVKNPHIDVSVQVSGDSTGLDSANISSSAQQTIKFNSDINLTTKSHRNIGGLSNTGPIPPRADIESTYTITWTISNTTNDLKDAVVTTTLPTGVSWKGEFVPQGEKISFDPDTRVVTWVAGTVSAGSGYMYSPKEVSFKVGVMPSATQVGQTLRLTDLTSLTSTDSYTGDTLKSTVEGVSTLCSDPGFKGTDGTVTK